MMPNEKLPLSERDVETSGNAASDAAAATPGSATLKCWNCRRTLTYDQRADADGQCPYCDAEIELGQYQR